MNINYLYDYVDSFERVLSYAYKNNYSLDSLERNISYSDFFQSLEVSRGFAPIIDDETLVKSIFPDTDFDLEGLVRFKECLWASESYLRIQEETHLTFEAIFIIYPIYRMYNNFDVFHEMDFSQIIDDFKTYQNKESVLSLLMDRFSYSINVVSLETGIPENTISSLKTRKRHMNKMNVENVSKLAKLFNVRIETIAELKL